MHLIQKGLFLFFWVCFPSLYAVSKPTVCLNMIVKNETAVIEKCLESVKPLINYWVIVDTGSTDGTQDLIKKTMKGIPGELHERPWINFAHNRNEALQLAKTKGDYLLLIDADEYFSYNKEEFSFPFLDKDCYYITVRQLGAVDFTRASLIKSSLPWNWTGVLHETLDGSIIQTCDLIAGIVNICNEREGISGRAKDPQKWLKDAAVLEEALLTDPDNPRSVFYLAQSYYAAESFELALKNYEKRAAMPSEDTQETFFSLYHIGNLRNRLGDPEGALKSFFQAFEFRPTRAEPLFQAAVTYRKMGNILLGYLLSKHALTMPKPQDTCIEYQVYEYQLLVELANCALLLGKWQEGLDACIKLLAYPNLPQDIKPQVLSNCDVALKHLSASKESKEQRAA